MPVAAGSVAFVAYSFDNFETPAAGQPANTDQQGFAFVALADIAAGEQIRFVDGQLQNNGSLNADAQVVWTNSSAVLKAGTVVQVSFTGYNSVNSGWTAASANVGTVTNPAALTYWNVDTTDSLYAVTGTAAAPGTHVASIVWGATRTNTDLNAGSVLNLNSLTPSTGNDVGMINAATANTAYASAAAARAAYTNSANWTTSNDADDNAGLDWPPLTDSESTLTGRTTLTTSTPTFSFGDANGLVNAAEASATPVTISGLGAGATAVVTFKSSANNTTVTGTFNGNGTANVNLSGLADGTVSITNVAVTSSGTTTNLANPPTSNSVALDKTAPNAPAITAVADDLAPQTGAVADGGATNDATPTVTVSLSGTNAVAGDTVKLLSGATEAASAALTAAQISAGSLTLAASSLGSDGSKSLTATVTDAAGNTSTASAARIVALDTAAPAVPSITGLTDDQAPQTGGIAANGATNDTTPTVVGTAEAGATVAVFDGGTQIGTTTANGSGAWSFTPGTALGQGAHSFTARATDAAGNQGNASSAYAFTIDTAAPNAPSIASVTDDQAPRTGTVAANGATNDTTLTVAVSLSGTGAVAGDTVTLLSNGAPVGTAVLTAAQVSAGSAAITSSSLGADGAKALAATVTDAAGNVSGASPAFNVTLDTAAPAAPAVTGVNDDFGSVTGPVAAGGATDDTTPTVAISLSGTGAVAGDTVALLVGGAQVASATLTAAQVGAGTVSLTSSALSGDGAKSLTATVTDAAGNQVVSSAYTVNLDTTAPAETATIGLVSDTGASSTDGVTSDPALSGTVPGGASGLTVTILDGATVVGTATTGAGGAWTFANAAAAEGAHSYTAAVTDAAGNRGAPSAALAVTLDKTAPTTTTTVALASDTGASPTDGVTSNPALSGTGPANATIVVKDGGAVIGTATANASGAWSFTPAGAAAADGPHTYTAQVSDLAGNLGPVGATGPASVTVDTSAPAVPTVSAVADNVGAAQGNLAGNARTDDNTLTLSGTAEAGATVQVFNGSTLVGTTTAASGGAWTLTTAALPDGGVSLTATATDAAGNASGNSPAFTATVDTAAPAAPVIGGVSDDAAPVTGAVAGGETTNDATPTLSGTAEAGATVGVYDGSTLLGTTTASGTGAWSFTTPSLAEGPHSLAARATDAAGNQGSASAAYAFTVDTTAPAETTTVRLVSDTGASATDGVTSDPALSGTVSNAAAGVTVTVFEGGAAIGTATTGANGAWTFTPSGGAAADGSHSYTARVTDAAGNLGPVGATGPASTTLDTAAPAETTTVRLASDTGASATDGITSDPALTGTVSNGAAGVLVTVLDGAAVLGTATSGAGGVWSFTPTGAGASPGAHSYAAAVTDAAGNRGAAASTGPATTTLDTAAPNQPSITGVSDDQTPQAGAVAAGGSTDDATPAVTISLSGTGAAAGDTVTLLSNGASVGGAVLTAAEVSAGSVTITSSALGADGDKALTATVTDAAGNVSSDSPAFTATLDTAAPAAPVLTAVSDDAGSAQGGLAAGATTDDNTLSLSGTAEANSTVAVFDGAAQLGTATADGGGAWGFTTPALADGPVSLTARAADAAGNRGGASTAFVATVDTAAPAVTSIAASGAGITAGDGALNAGRAVTLTVNAAEALFVTGTPTLALSSGGTATYQSGSGTASLVFAYTVAAGENTADLAVSALELPSGAAIRDAAGNALAFDAGAVGNPAGTLVVDTAAPAAAPAITGVADDAGAATGPLAAGAATDDVTPTATLSLAGTGAAAGDTLALFADGAQVASKVLDATDIAAGSVDLPASALSGDGVRALTATVTDAAGNASAVSAAFNIVLDTAAPAAPAFAGATDNQAPAAGALADGASTNDATPTLSGTAEAGATVAVFDGGTQIGTATADGTGAWSFTPGAALAQGAHSFTARATDAAGNQGPASAAFGLTVDTAAPAAAPAISGVTDDAGAAIGAVADGGVTDDATPTVALSLSGTGAAAGDTVALFADGAPVASKVLTAADIGAGAVSLAASPLPGDGPKSLAATLTDAAGNASAASAAFGIVLDTAAPAAPSVVGVSDDRPPGIGLVADGGQTNDDTPTIYGTAEPRATIAVFDGAARIGTAAAGGDGLWSFTPPAALAEGAHSLSVRAVDAAGNEGPASGALAFTVDTIDPANTTTLELASDTGASGNDGVTSNPALRGTVSGDSAGLSVIISDGPVVIGTATIGAGGSWSFANTGAPDGAHAYSAVVTDGAGNRGPYSVSLAVDLDSSAPSDPAIDAIADDAGASQGNLADGASTDDNTLALSGTAEAGATVDVYNGSTLVGTATANGTGAWALTTSALPDGAHAFTARAADAAGNQGPASAAFNVVVDTAAPAAPAITAVTDDAGAVTGPVAAGGSTDDTTPTVEISLAGTSAVAGDTVRLLADGSQVASAVLTAADIAAGTVALTSSALGADGAKSLAATVTDAAGNTSGASGAFGITLDTTAPAETSTVALASDTGDSASDGITTDASLAGTVSSGAAGVLVTVLDGAAVVGTATTGAGGAWSFANASAAEGAHSYTARVTDEAGNRGPASAPLAVTLDRTAPTDTVTVALASDTGASATDGVTSDPALTGTGPANATIVVKDGAAVLGSATSDANGVWSFAPTGTAAGDGAHSYTAQVADAAGNLGPASNALAATLDTAAPGAPAIGTITDDAGGVTGTVASGASTDDAAPTVQVLLSGTGAAAGDTVTVAGASVVLTAADISAGSLSFDVPLGADGTKILSATVADAAGNVSTASAARSLVLDTAPPAAPAPLALASDTGASATDGVTSDPTVTGTAEAGSTVMLRVGATVVGTGTADGSGSFSITPTGLAQGPNTITATATDAAGNAGPAASLAFAFDTAAPAAPSIGGVADDQAPGTGAVADGDVTDDATPAISGTAEANSAVAVFDGATRLGTATADSTGAWSFTPGTALAQGPHSLTARATDAAGNEGAASAAFAFTVDTGAPDAPSIASVTDDQAPQTGNVAAGGATNDTTPVVRVSLSGTGAAAGDAAQVLADGAAAGGATLTAADIAAGYVDVTAALSGDGAKVLAAQVVDGAGNASPASAAFNVVLDTQPPAATPTIGLAADTGTPGDGITSDPTLAGTGPANGTIVIKDGATVLGTAVADGSGAWTFTPTGAGAADGTHAYTAQVSDDAGNLGPAAATTPATVTVDTQAPAETATIGLVSDTGASATDGVTSDPALAGTVSSGAAGLTVAVFDNGTAIGTATTGAGGAWTFANPGAADGAHSYTAAVTDAAGNQGAASAALAATLDTATPSAPAIAGVTDDAGGLTGAVASGGTTDDAAPTVAVSLAGTGAVAGDTVRLLADGAEVGSVTLTAADISAGSASIAPSAPLSGDGPKAITAQVVDAAGNVSLASAPRGIVLDTAAPAAPTIAGALDDQAPGTGAVADGGATNDAAPTLSGTAEAGATVTVYDGANALGSTTADGSGAWSFTPATALGDGAHSLTARAADAAGNQGTASAAFNVTVDTSAPGAPAIAGVTDDAGAVTSAVAAGGSTHDATPTVAVSLLGTGAAVGDTVKLFVGGAEAASATLTLAEINAGTVALAPATALSGDGAKALAAQVVDAAGTASPASAAFNIVLDTAAPGAPTGLALANDTGALGDDLSSDPTVEGFAEAGSTVVLRVGAAVVGTGVADATTGAFSIAPTGLAQGGHAVTATATDAAGNQGAAADLAFTLDTVAPAVTSVTASAPGAADGTGTVAAGTVVVVTLNADKAVVVAGAPTLSLNNGGTATYTGGSGTQALTFSYTVAGGQDAADLAVTALNLPPGSAVRDAAGNPAAFDPAAVGNPAGTLAIDTTPPAETATIRLVSDTGASATDGVTSAPALAGTVSNGAAGVTVSILDGTTVVGTATTGAGGAWSFANAAAADGAHSYAAAVTDGAGNRGPAGAPALAVTLDRQATPAAPAITGVTDDAGGVTGPVAAGAATDDATPTVALSLSGSGAVAGDALALFANGSQVASKVLTAADIAAGSVSLAAAALSGDGAKSLTATITDAAGNASAVSAARAIVLDTTAPGAPAITGFADDQVPQTGAVASGGATNDATPTLSGTAEAGATVSVYDRTALLGTATASGTGAWSFTPGSPLADGLHGLTARATDAAGNQGTASAAYMVAVDTAAPAETTTVRLVSDTGTSATDRITSSPALTGAASNGAAGVLVTILDGAAVVGTATTGAGGAWSFANAAAADGAHSYAAAVTDGAGNRGPAVALGASIDRQAPTETATVRLASDTGPSPTDGVTSDPALAGAVSGGAAGVLVTILDGAAAVGTATTGAGGAWTFANAGAADGTHVYAAAVTDAAGNLGPASAPPLSMTLDTVPPTAAPTTTVALAADTGTPGDRATANPALTGTLSSGEAGVAVTVFEGAAAVGTAVTGAGGVWRFANLTAADAYGPHTYTAAAVDLAGNRGPASAPLAVAIDRSGDDDLLFLGTSGPESIAGEAGSDRIAGLGGDDTLRGDDTAGAAAGDDTLDGGAGDDVLLGGGGGDALAGGPGDDLINGGPGTDTADYSSGRRSDFILDSTKPFFMGDSVVLIDTRNGGEGRDTLTGVESFTFADGAVSVAELVNSQPRSPDADPGQRPPATVFGTGGDDRLALRTGGDTFDGLGGRDWLDLTAEGSRDSVITVLPDGTVDLTHGGGRTDELYNIEEVRFLDGRVVFDPADIAAQVARLYAAALDRLPDQGGFNFWVQGLQVGYSLSAISDGFLDSREFQARFGDATAGSGGFVDRLYLNVLGRPGEAEGRAFWVDALERGTSRADVLVAFSESPENKAGTTPLIQTGIWDRSETAAEVARLYDTVLGRLPDAPGLAYWKAGLDTGTVDLAQAAGEFTGGAEFRATYGALSNRDFANALYVNTLGRPAEAEGLAFWTDRLDAGVARSAVVLAFSESQEHIALTADAIQSEKPGEFGILFA